MRHRGRWIGLTWMVAGAVAAQACGDGSAGTTSAGSTSSSASSSATGAGGGSSSSSSATGTGGGSTGTGGAGAPFTSHGAASYEAQTSVAADAKGGVVASFIGFFADGTSLIGYAVSRDGGG